MSTTMHRAGALLRGAVETPEPEAPHALLRDRLVTEAARRRERRPARLVVAFAAAGAFALLVAIWLARPSSRSPITFAVGSRNAPARLSGSASPAADQQVALFFSEGSVVTLHAQARAHVQATTDRGALVRLEQGKVRCDIVHRAGAQWTLAAGPYTVQVRGTTFEASFEPASSSFELRTLSGVVSVRGPGLEADAEVRGGQRFVAAPASARIEPLPGLAEPPLPAAAAGWGDPFAPAASPQVAPLPAASRGSPPGLVEGRGHAPAPSGSSAAKPGRPDALDRWAALVARGELAEVLARAERTGLEAVLADAPSEDLEALADAARFSGRTELARRALRAVRARFAGSARAASAAFLLGRLSDDAGDSRAATGWYEAYLHEAPAGALAPEAAGRRMIALRAAGEPDAARAAARAYVRDFPSGPYAGLAREIASR
jgi:hypothetical protein